MAAPVPADAATRAAYERADPLARSIFWSNEHNLNPLDPEAGVKMAQALRELGQYDQAASAADNVLTAQPDNYEAMLELGRAHIARGQAFYGIAALERARDARPRDWRPLSLLAWPISRCADLPMHRPHGRRPSACRPTIPMC